MIVQKLTLQLAPSKDKLEKSVLQTLVVIVDVTVLMVESVLQFVLLMDVSVLKEQSLMMRKMNV